MPIGPLISIALRLFPNDAGMHSVEHALQTGHLELAVGFAIITVVEAGVYGGTWPGETFPGVLIS